MNDTSSRSHSIFTIYVEVGEEVAEPNNPAKKRMCYKIGKLNLVDLAGSERQSKTNATG